MIDDPMLYNFYTVSIIDYFSDLTVRMLVIVNILVFACTCVASAFPLPYGNIEYAILHIEKK